MLEVPGGLRKVREMTSSRWDEDGKGHTADSRLGPFKEKTPGSLACESSS